MGFIFTVGTAIRPQRQKVLRLFSISAGSFLVVPYVVTIWVSFCLISGLERSFLIYKTQFRIDNFWLGKSDNWSY